MEQKEGAEGREERKKPTEDKALSKTGAGASRSELECKNNREH
jgi:hypothetical protein